MRHQYVPLFEDILDSRVWEEPAPTLKVWIWFLVSADPEGFRGGTARSVARGANVTEDEARAALAFLCSPDPESRDDEHGGRMLEPVARGWRVVNLGKWRELAKREAQRAHNRRYMQRAREAGPSGVDVESRGVDVESTWSDVEAPKPKPIPKPKPPEQSSGSGGAEPPPIIEVFPKGWLPSEATIAHAVGAGLPRDELMDKIRGLYGRKIGGKTPPTDLDAYCVGLVPSWRRWYEERRAKELTERATGIPAGRPKGLPAWVHPEHVELASTRGIQGEDLARHVSVFAKKHALHRSEPPPAELYRMFREYLQAA